jgi:hypothetical protein
LRDHVPANEHPETPGLSGSNSQRGKCVQEYFHGSQIAKNMLDSYDPEGYITNDGLLYLRDAILNPAKKQFLGGKNFI